MRTFIKGSAYALIFLILTPPVYAEYVLGDGFSYGDLYISGYSKLAWEAPNNQPQELVLDDLSLFASASLNQYINPFIEAEITKAQLWQEGNGADIRYARGALERLYNDVHLTEALNLRLGKSLAPVGEWNRIHAAPLVWTTTRPITTQFSFAESVSGINLQYTQQDNTAYQVYYQPGREWVSKQREINRPFQFKDVFGVSVDKYFGLDGKVGVGAQHATITGTEDRQWVFSIDGQWKLPQLDLEFQTTYTDVDFKLPTTNTRKEWGGYVQAVWHVNERWHAVIRPEHFRSRYGQSQSSLLYGMVYQPIPELSLKLEYVDAQSEQSFGLSQGWFGSLAVLF